jgi:formate dehydrogenase major subunit
MDFLLEHHIDLPHICQLQPMGPIQSRDSCWVEVGGELKRACARKSAE